MRTDEEGNQCPSTLGEYHDLCVVLFGKDSRATQFLAEKIMAQGRNEAVLAADSQMRYLLFSMALDDDRQSSADDLKPCLDDSQYRSGTQTES